VFREALEMLEMLGLAYRAEILCEKGRLVEEYLPILVYAPTSFAPQLHIISRQGFENSAE